MLTREFKRAGIDYPAEKVRVIDSWRIYCAKEPRDLASAYRFYCGKELEGAHGAEADALAAANILTAQVERYADLPCSTQGLDEFCHRPRADRVDPDGRFVWKGGKVVIGFGKHRDRPLEVLAAEAPDYLRWMANSDFTPQVVAIARAALRGEFPKREAEQVSLLR